MTAPQDSTKLSARVLHNEKKLLDMEIAVHEMKEIAENLKNVNPAAFNHLNEIPEFIQRMEDIEDLIMVENAGVQEIKDILEDIAKQGGSPLQAAQSPAPQTETEHHEAPAPVEAKIPEDLEKKMGELSELSDRIKGIEDLIGQLHAKDAQGESPSPKLAEVNKDIINRNISTVQSRIDGLEDVVKSLSDEIRKVNTTTQQINTYDKVTSFMSKMDSKMNELQQTEERLHKIYDSVGAGEIQKIKRGIEEMHRNDINALKDKLEKTKRSVSQIGISDIEKVLNGVEMRMDHMEKRIDEMDFSTVSQDTKKMSDMVEQLQQEITSFGVGDINQNFKTIIRRLTEVEGKMDNVESKSGIEGLEDINQNFKNISHDIEDLREELKDKAGIADIEPAKNRIADLERLPTEFRKIKDEFAEKVAKNREPLEVFGIEMSDMSSRMIGLETRLGRLENLLQRSGAMRPVVLE